jgi:hypothetical protein
VERDSVFHGAVEQFPVSELEARRKPHHELLSPHATHATHGWIVGQLSWGSTVQQFHDWWAQGAVPFGSRFG